MARKKHGAEQIVALLRQIEVELANHIQKAERLNLARTLLRPYQHWPEAAQPSSEPESCTYTLPLCT